MARYEFLDALTPAEADAIADGVGYRSFDDPLFAGLMGRVRSGAPDVILEEPSYCRVEARPEGHPWHTDLGTAGHMGWCRWSAGMLLTSPDTFSGGGLYFRDRPDDPLFHYCDLWVWDSGPLENAHCVTRSRGDRRVLIMFFAEAEDF